MATSGSHFLDVGISLNGQEYKLARKEVLERVGRARSWQVQRVPATTKIEPRSDVRAGEIPGEYVITKQWGNGVGGDREPLPGIIHWSSGWNHTEEGMLTALGVTNSEVFGTDWEGAP